MNNESLRRLLENVRNDRTGIDEAIESIREAGLKDLGFATIDTHRELRTGYPEVIFGQGKTPEQLAEIIRFMLTDDCNILATRVSGNMVEKVMEVCPDAVYHPVARTITVERKPRVRTETYIAIVTAGT